MNVRARTASLQLALTLSTAASTALAQSDTFSVVSLDAIPETTVAQPVSVASYTRMIPDGTPLSLPTATTQPALARTLEPTANGTGRVYLIEADNTLYRTIEALPTHPSATYFGASMAGVRVDRFRRNDQILIGSANKVYLHEVAPTSSPDTLRGVLEIAGETDYGMHIATLGDLNGDGVEDFSVSSRTTLRIYDGREVLTAMVATPVGTTVPGDSPQFVLATHTQGALGVNITIPALAQCAGMADGVADANGDNLDDYAFVRATSAPGSTTGFSLEIHSISGLAQPPIPLPNGFFYRVAGGRDVDGDSLPDIAVLRTTTPNGPGEVAVCLSSAGYSPSTWRTTVLSAVDIELSDVDNDTFADIAVGGVGSGVDYWGWDPNANSGAGSLVRRLALPMLQGGGDIASLNDEASNTPRALVAGGQTIDLPQVFTSLAPTVSPLQIHRDVLGRNQRICVFNNQLRARATLDYQGGTNANGTSLRLIMNRGIPGSSAVLYLMVGGGPPLSGPPICDFLPSVISNLLVATTPAATAPPVVADAVGTASFTLPVAGAVNTDLYLQVVSSFVAVPGAPVELTTSPVMWIDYR